MPVKEWLLRWIHYVEFLERALGYRMEEAAGWITSHSHSLHNVSIAIYFFFNVLHYLQKIIIFLPAFSDIDKICKLSVSSRSVYSSGISFCVIGFLKHFQTISQKLFTQHIPMASRRLLLRNLHARVKHRQNVWIYDFDPLTTFDLYVKGLKSWVNTFSLCVTLGFLGNISLKSLSAFAMKQ